MLINKMKRVKNKSIFAPYLLRLSVRETPAMRPINGLRNLLATGLVEKTKFRDESHSVQFLLILLLWLYV